MDFPHLPIPLPSGKKPASGDGPGKRTALFRTLAGGRYGGVAEWLKALVSKTGRRVTVSWVRIPPPPPTHDNCRLMMSF